MQEEERGNGPASALQSGGRVYLRRPLHGDGAEYLALRRASAAFHVPWEPAPTAGNDPYGEESFRRYLRESQGERRVCTLLCLHGDRRIVGAFNWSEITRGALQSAYLGYWVGEEFAGQGYMREGLRLALRHSFEDLLLHRVEANVRPENEASIALVRSGGFRKEGFSPNYLKIAGEWCDHERWALLVDEWRAR